MVDDNKLVFSSDMKQFKPRQTIRLAKRMLLYKSLQLFGMGERLNRGEMLVKVWDTFMKMEEDTMDDVSENYMMSETCPAGGHHNNILRYAGTIEEEADEAFLCCTA